MDQESLRLLVRRKLQDGRLPHDGIRRVAGSPSAGETCDACDAILAMDQLLMEGITLACDAILAMDQLLMEGITLDLGRKPLQLHVRCFQMWDHERRVT